MIIKKKNCIVDEFQETHKLKIHSILNIKKLFNSNFKLINIFKWMKFKTLLKNDWFGLIVFKKIK